MEWLEHIIDNSFAEMAKDKSMKMPGKIPEEMLDLSIPASDDWRGWKPIKSIITDEDLNKLEKRLTLHLPLSYRHFLKYKHFFELSLPDYAIQFPSHLPDKNLYWFIDRVFQSWEPEYLIGRNYIYFADFNDYGLLCFDANEPRENNEYKIVFIDHEDLETVHEYATNFRELMESDSEAGNRFIERLNDFYS